jgi:hypothetical protein
MQPNLLMAIILPFICCCSNFSPGLETQEADTKPEYPGNPFSTVADIPLPKGYRRVSLNGNSFGAWLRNYPLKKDKTVYYFDGRKKANQSAQFAVLDLNTGKEDLQQCADAVMRLRAEYFFERKDYAAICFSDNSGKKYRAPANGDRDDFEKYLRQVFAYCGTLSLEKQLKPVGDISKILPGDIFIRGGSPGHAAIVMDVAINERGERIFLLANSYMPAQDTHIVINPADEKLSPWFSANSSKPVELPEWTFSARQLNRW